MRSDKLRQALTALAALLLPSRAAVYCLRLLGHRVAPDARIGFSLLQVGRLHLGEGCRIGHFNFIQVRRLAMGVGSNIGRSNLLIGHFSVLLRERGALGNRNRILRAPVPEVAHGPSNFSVGHWSKVTSDHKIDCTCSVRIGQYTTVAGSGSQFWTHGYVHALRGPARYRVDGRISIGDNVYVGSSCIITHGVRLAAGVIVGAGATVARSLDEPGLYVSAGLRRLERPADPDMRADLERIDDPRLCEPVYRKRAGG